ncbi:MAG: type II toxin-antitoxin system PemK/MazF family toxin [Acidobacteriota bacterium]
MPVSRGEVYLAAIPGQTKPRPAVVLTADWLSRYALDVTVVPLTSVARGGFPTRVELAAGEGGLQVRSYAKCDQVTTIPKALLAGRPFGRLPAARMKGIEDAVRLSLGI